MLSEKILYVAAAQGEAQIEPDCVLNDRGRKAMSSIRELSHARRYPTGHSSPPPPSVPDSIEDVRFAADSPLEGDGFEPLGPRKRTLFETAPFELTFPMPREGPRLRISVPPPPSVAEGILTRPSSFVPN